MPIRGAPPATARRYRRRCATPTTGSGSRARSDGGRRPLARSAPAGGGRLASTDSTRVLRYARERPWRANDARCCGKASSPAWSALPRTLVGAWGAVLGEGVVAGIIGAAVVALWFFAIDAIHGEMLRTPRLLGAALLRQQTPTSAVLVYTVVHGAAFVLFGIIGAFLIAGAERQPMLIFTLVILFTSFEIFFFGLILIAASWVMDELAGWTVFVGNVLAAAAMLAFYFRRHRTLAHKLAAAWETED